MSFQYIQQFQPLNMVHMLHLSLSSYYCFKTFVTFRTYFYRIRDILPLLAQEVFKSKDEVEISIFRNNAIQAINEFVNIDIDIIKSLNLHLQNQGYESYFLNLQKS